MIKLATDENFKDVIIRVLRKRIPEIDLIRVQVVGMFGENDPTILEWCASESCILLTHDVSTVTYYAYERVRNGLSMPGVIEIKCHAHLQQIADDLEIFVQCSHAGEWDNQIVYLPFK